MIRGETDSTVRRYVPPESVEEQWDPAGLQQALLSDFQMQAPVDGLGRQRPRAHR